MSELNTEELAENIAYTVDDAEVIPTPIDPTLSNAGEAADAKATGDAIAAVLNNVSVNGKAATAGAVTIYASDILMSSAQGAQDIAEMMQDVGGRTASDIIYADNDTIHDVVESIDAKTAEDILFDPDETDTISDVVGSVTTALEAGISNDDIDDIFDAVFEEDS